MRKKHPTLPALCLAFMILLAPWSAAADASDAGALVEAAFRYWRGAASESVVEMRIHRPDWERRFVIEAWTRGDAESLFRIVDPPKDRGNGTLKRGREMWMFNPKVNRTIKLPPSMMAQAWMGSDFSNNDLAKTDSLLHDYTHRLTGTRERDGETVQLVTSMPKPDAPVIWGMQKLEILDGRILIRQEFFDEDLSPVKCMTASGIEMIGGRRFPRHWRMEKSDARDEYTEFSYRELSFTDSLPDRIFTISNLKRLGR